MHEYAQRKRQRIHLANKTNPKTVTFHKNMGGEQEIFNLNLIFDTV